MIDDKVDQTAHDLRYLVAGMSHTNSIGRALTDRPELANVAVVNLRKRLAGDEPTEWPFKPDVVCLSIAGNQHNIMTLFEQPRPFTVAGMVFDDKPRVSIPLEVMKDTINEKNQRVRVATQEMHDLFPDAKFAYLCAPPPVANTDTIRTMPELFEKMSRNGYAPNGLRLFIHQLQSEWYAALASENGAMFIAPPPEALTDDGMLSSEFCAGDPTHGNRDYGNLVLNQIMTIGA